MRHFKRIYFDNIPVEGAHDNFVAIFDKRRDAAGLPMLSQTVGRAETIGDSGEILESILGSPCFFKLPVGASAVVDVYVSPLISEPAVFDYQVFKAKPRSSSRQDSKAESAATATQLYKATEGIAQPPEEPEEPEGPIGTPVARSCPQNTPCHNTIDAKCNEGQDPRLCSPVCEGSGWVCRNNPFLPMAPDVEP